MKTDVRETDESYELDIDLPGFKKDEISAQVANGYLTISAQKGLDKDEKDKKAAYTPGKALYGQLRRSLFIGEDIREDEVSAKFENGIFKTCNS